MSDKEIILSAAKGLTQLIISALERVFGAAAAMPATRHAAALYDSLAEIERGQTKEEER